LRLLLFVLPAAILGITLVNGCGGDGNQPDRNGPADGSPNSTTATPLHGEAPTPQPHPVTTPTTVATPLETIAPPGNFTPAIPGPVQSQCTTEGDVTATLTWAPAEPQGQAQRVELAPDFDEFVPGNYTTSQTLPAGESALIWTGLISGLDYFWRVSTETGDGWVAGESEGFTTIGCPPIDRRG